MYRYSFYLTNVKRHRPRSVSFSRHSHIFIKVSSVFIIYSIFHFLLRLLPFLLIFPDFLISVRNISPYLLTIPKSVPKEYLSYLDILLSYPTVFVPLLSTVIGSIGLIGLSAYPDQSRMNTLHPAEQISFCKLWLV